MSTSNSVVYWGTGRRKTSVARVRLVPGNGTITINGRPGDNYLNYNPAYISAVKAPLQTLGLTGEYDVLVNVRGGGLTGQADACLLYTSPSPRDKRQSRMPSSA